MLFFSQLIALLFCSVMLFAADEKGLGHIKGIITTNDGKPASGVSVQLKGLKKQAITEENGTFHFRNIKPGTYELEATYVGYEKQVQSITVTEDKTLEVSIQLSVSSMGLNEVNITSKKNNYTQTDVSNSLRLGEPILSTPQNIQIVTGKVMADQQITSLSDGVIRNVSGATRLEHWGDIYTRINMRGSRAANFRNGMNITSTWGPLTEDMGVVDHVEFVKGPAGFMMSNGEPSGIVNIVTKKPTGITKGEASFMLGSYDLYRAAVDLDGKLDQSGKVLYRLNMMGQTKNSFRDYEFNDRISIAPVITYKLDENTTLTTEYTYQHVKMSNVGSYYVFSTDGYATLPRNFTLAEPGIDPTNINDHSILVNLQHRFNPNWKLTAQAAYFNYAQEGSSMWPDSVGKTGVVRRVSIWDASNESKFGQVFVNGEEQTGFIHHRVLAGLDLGNKKYMADWGQSHALDLPTEGGIFSLVNPVYGRPANGLPVWDRSKSLRVRAGSNVLSQSYTGLYLQDELGFLDDMIRLTLAGRYTYVKESSYGSGTEDKRFTPRVGLSVSVDPGTSFYALYDQSFVPQTGLLRSGEKVKPVTGNNMEVGVKKDLFNSRWSSTVSVYRILKNNELSADPSDPTGTYYLQLGQTKTEGVEFDARGEIVNGLNLVVNYAYTDSRISKSGTNGKKGDKVTGYATHVANGWLTYRLRQGVLKGLGISGGFSFQGDRSTWSWAAANQKDLPDYFRLDGGLSWEKDRITINANMFNLLDKYLYSGAAYGTYYYWQAEPGRNLKFSLAYKF
ncbi:TonB-dependent siderophore receptor [Chitinophaga tropicalis]|uniref:TonB-dependent siderophore receptor n=1 Tax=Chitinophaga tropicalis TaxID=2683588 RepID=A0A7K1U2A0_9BACT|nr:TonB-dependent siderophore receptor [Chitinophaga tropicalis]MVT08487.1 TonB-dependent siderophore receptor [Chitinophaga tropicalis]